MLLGKPNYAGSPSPAVVWVGALALAALSLLLWEPQAVFDPYAWAIWGRDLAGLDLDTAAGPSWKPLPVLVCALLSPLGEALPAAWVLIARTGMVAMVAFCATLAVRLEPSGGRGRRAAAAALAVVFVLLLADAITPLARQFHGGLSEPLAAALFLLALERRLADRRGAALAALFAAGLMRPEALLLLALCLPWLWHRRDRAAPLAAGLLGAGALLWLLGDLLGSGDALTGAERARTASLLTPGEAVEALWWTLSSPPWAAWAGAAWLLASDSRRRLGPRLVLAASLAWIAIVVAMTLAGFAGLPRFALPAAAAVSAAGAAGLPGLAVAALAWGRSSPARAVAALLAGALLAAQLPVRAGALAGDVSEAERRASALSGAEAIVASVGRERMFACGRVQLSDPLARTALAWWLAAPIGRVVVPSGRRAQSGPAVAAVGPDASAALAAGLAKGERLGEVEGWRAYAFTCPRSAVARSAESRSGGRGSGAESR